MPKVSAMSSRLLGLLAHEGGWDELLLVAGPIVVIIAVLAVAKRRVDAVASRRDEQAVTGKS